MADDRKLVLDKLIADAREQLLKEVSVVPFEDLCGIRHHLKSQGWKQASKPSKGMENAKLVPLEIEITRKILSFLQNNGGDIDSPRGVSLHALLGHPIDSSESLTNYMHTLAVEGLVLKAKIDANLWTRAHRLNSKTYRFRLKQKGVEWLNDNRKSVTDSEK